MCECQEPLTSCVNDGYEISFASCVTPVATRVVRNTPDTPVPIERMGNALIKFAVPSGLQYSVQALALILENMLHEVIDY